MPIYLVLNVNPMKLNKWNKYKNSQTIWYQKMNERELKSWKNAAKCNLF